MTPRPRALVLALVALAACARASTIAPAGTSAGATSADITEADLRRRLFLIADDSMMGRETGSEGALQGRRSTSPPSSAGSGSSPRERTARTSRRCRSGARRSIRIDPHVRNTSLPDRRRRSSSVATGARQLPGAGPQLTGSKARTSIYGGSLADTMQLDLSGAGGGQARRDSTFPGSMPPFAPAAASPQRWRGARRWRSSRWIAFPPRRSARLREGRPVADTARNPNRRAADLDLRAPPPRRCSAADADRARHGGGTRVRGRFDFPRVARRLPGAQRRRRSCAAAIPRSAAQYVVAHGAQRSRRLRPRPGGPRFAARVQSGRPADGRRLAAARPRRRRSAARIRTILDSLRRVHRRGSTRSATAPTTTARARSPSSRSPSAWRAAASVHAARCCS